jgi:hypothetical protein
VIFVPAGEDHHFDEVTEDLALLVVFGPAYGSRVGGAHAASPVSWAVRPDSSVDRATAS